METKEPTKETKLNPFEQIIKAYLDKCAEEDELFAATYAKPKKNIKDCCKYIVSEAKKAKDGQVAVIADATVYGWAKHYYDEDDIKIEETPARVVAPKPQPKPEPKKVEPEKPKERQLSIFDFL